MTNIHYGKGYVKAGCDQKGWQLAERRQMAYRGSVCPGGTMT
jgi:hypothetical protein